VGTVDHPAAERTASPLPSRDRYVDIVAFVALTYIVAAFTAYPCLYSSLLSSLNSFRFGANSEPADLGAENAAPSLRDRPFADRTSLTLDPPLPAAENRQGGHAAVLQNSMMKSDSSTGFCAPLLDLSAFSYRSRSRASVSTAGPTVSHARGTGDSLLPLPSSPRSSPLLTSLQSDILPQRTHSVDITHR